jgi:hypothetical protein
MIILLSCKMSGEPVVLRRRLLFTFYRGAKMKKIILIICISLINAGIVTAGNVPTSIAGFALGDNLFKHKEKIVKDSTMCIRYQNYINEVEVTNCQGYKVGLIGVGNCADPDKIIRIKLKYINSSKNFYNNLLKRCKKKFGKPHVWKGDAFGVVYAWKWSFADENGNKISMTLQHNSEDHEMKMGNSIKLTMTSSVEKEKACYDSKKQDEMKERIKPVKKQSEDAPPDWDMLIPR